MENKVAAVTEKLPEIGGGIMDHWMAIIIGIVVVCGAGWLVWKKMKKDKLGQAQQGVDIGKVNDSF